MNFINNAIKFTSCGGKVKIYIRDKPEFNLIYLSVSDTGEGMNPEILSQICKPYVTFNFKNSNKYGNGIGLCSSQTIISQIGPCEKLFITSVEG
jgi:signal transduction histidine kinase